MRCEGMFVLYIDTRQARSYELQGGTDTDVGKVNILLQAYISKSPIEDFALVSDTAYVAQVLP